MGNKLVSMYIKKSNAWPTYDFWVFTDKSNPEKGHSFVHFFPLASKYQSVEQAGPVYESLSLGYNCSLHLWLSMILSSGLDLESDAKELVKTDECSLWRDLKFTQQAVRAVGKKYWAITSPSSSWT
jgi:hypothetical protein